ncbi:hypothetical protein GOD44_06060 [Sinorhizobium medicae]|nr:hypothetical protein [Sinorhizobium medicae]
MARSIRKEVPKGTRLDLYLRGLQAECREAHLEQSGEPVLRSIGVWAKLKEEPRLWALPRDFVRDELVLPAIARIEGLEAADALRQYLPSVLSEYVDLVCENAKRHATARQRLAPEPDNSPLVCMIVLGVLYDGNSADRTPNAGYERTAERLGVKRGAVRRIDQDFRRRVARLEADEREQCLWAVIAMRDIIRDLDKKVGVAGKRQQPLSIPALVDLAGYEHSLRRTSNPPT